MLMIAEKTPDRYLSGALLFRLIGQKVCVKTLMTLVNI